MHTTSSDPIQMGYEDLPPLTLLGEGTAAQEIQEISYWASIVSTPNLLKFRGAEV